MQTSTRAKLCKFSMGYEMRLPTRHRIEDKLHTQIPDIEALMINGTANCRSNSP